MDCAVIWSHAALLVVLISVSPIYLAVARGEECEKVILLVRPQSRVMVTSLKFQELSRKVDRHGSGSYLTLELKGNYIRDLGHLVGLYEEATRTQFGNWEYNVHFVAYKSDEVIPAGIWPVFPETKPFEAKFQVNVDMYTPSVKTMKWAYNIFSDTKDSSKKIKEVLQVNFSIESGWAWNVTDVP